HLTGVAEHGGLAGGPQRRVRRIDGADHGRRGVRAVIRGQQYSRRARVLELDEVWLVLDVEGRPEPSRQARFASGDVDANLTDGGMGQEIAPEERVMLGLDGAALPRPFHPLGTAAAGAMQAQPAAACFEPALDGAALRGV